MSNNLSAIHKMEDAAEALAQARVQGRVWEDSDADQLRDEDEAGIAGATVELVRDLDGDGRIAADEVVARATTDADGIYSFDNVAPGDGYQLRFATPGGFDASLSEPLSEPMTLQPGDNGSNADIGFFRHATLGDRAWNDADANGVQDAGETGRPGVQVELWSAFRGNVGEGGSVLEPVLLPRNLLAVQTTGSDGSYAFEGLAPGEYIVKFVAPDGTVLSTANAAVDDAADSDADPATGLTGAYLLASGAQDTSADAGLVSTEPAAATLGGQVWHDANADELAGTGERGIAGATVELLRDLDGDGQVGDGDVVASTVTDANGNYRFADLTPGVAFQLRFVTPDGYDATAGSPLSEPVVLQPGQQADVGLGFFKYASLGDRVWNDADADGLQDAGESGRAGASVELYAVSRGDVGEGGNPLPSKMAASPGELLATQQTDADGNYAFDKLTPGEYMVRFVAQDGTVLTAADVGADDALDSDADVSTGFTGVQQLASGERVGSVDAGVLALESTDLAADSLTVCEDRSKSFNVLANDSGADLKLVGVSHESSSLDSTFKSRGGAISFTSDGRVTYKSMTNYYGYDKLVYTVEDSQGNQFTQKVSVTVKAVSDAPTGSGGDTRLILSFSEALRSTSDDGWRKTIKIGDFGSFGDEADRRQTFGSYNTGVANDIDSAKYVRLYGLTTGKSDGEIYYKGKELRFGASKYYDIPVADIKSGKLQIDFSKEKYTYKLKFAWVDSGKVDNGSCYDGSVVSKAGYSSLVTSPIALDLDGDGKIGVTGATTSSQKDASAPLGATVQFDIDADGRLDTIEWFDGSGDGILVDNRDGLAATRMDGARLFGDAGNSFANGYDKLASLDLNGDGQLSGAELEGLVLWLDDGNARVDAGELQSLEAQRIVSLSTRMDVVVDTEGRGLLQSAATRSDGSQVLTEDVYFAHGQDLPQTEELVSDEAALDALVGPAGAAVPEVAFAQPNDAGELGQAAELLRKMAAAAQGDAMAA